MINVYIETTSRCNLCCPICPYKKITRPKRDMSIALFEQVISQVSKNRQEMKLDWLHGYGEPLLNPNLPEMLEFVDRMRIIGYGMSTNGILLTENLSAMLSNHPLNLIVAVDTYDPFEYTELTGGHSHSEVVENLKQLISISKGKRLTVSIQGMMTLRNDEVKKRKMMEMFGTHPHVRYFWKNCTPFKDTNPILTAHPREFAGRRCQQPQSNLVIAESGICTACCSDFNIDQPIGDANTEKLMDIWNGAKRKEQIERMRKGEWNKLPVCKGCVSLYLA